ncbi:GAF domain-containing protein [Arsukibacterium sp.]|uniref:GAF domain-containing protein n=1 Tax=Arsukibacterium sp. TaxID=1977258 RepID=UPI00299D2F2D|nr:GAF domain-containing protein [Arsukibacterium sp.]MDX1678005.1 GAF domain-containing protein [Arsukibacterium sp.]
MKLTLQALRRCFEGAVPSALATCDVDGIPNVAYLSHAHYIDDDHLALSFQFFNTTRRNILANSLATLQVIDPLTAAIYQIDLKYLHTETSGPLFEYMKAKLAGIASHAGMSKIFHLQGSDVYRVLDVRFKSGSNMTPDSSSVSLVPALRSSIKRLAACKDITSLLDETLACLESEFKMPHAMLLMHDQSAGKLYTLASRGYDVSGVGSEIALGEGIIGVAAREGIPVRIGHMAQEYLYSHAVRQSFLQSQEAPELETEIPLPGLATSRSQLAVPVIHQQRLLGVLYAESVEEMRFSWEDEDALLIVADFLAQALSLQEYNSEPQAELLTDMPPVTLAAGKPATIDYYVADHSVFIDNDYLIKGVAGAIMWKLLRQHIQCGRTEFSNRELRLDSSLGLPDIGNNLEARLILLQRRLAERCSFLSIDKAGRGRFRLSVSRPLYLKQIGGN